MRLPPPLQKALNAWQSDRQAAVQALRADLKELISALRDQQAADRQQKKQTGDFESNLPERILRAERKIHEYAERENRAYRNLELTMQVLLVAGTWAAFIAAIIYATVALGQWREMIRAADASAGAANTAVKALEENKRQFDETLIQMQAQTAEQDRTAGAAEGAANTARDALERSQRPWIGVVGMPTVSNFRAVVDSRNHTVVTGKISYQVMNYGTSPALHLNSDITPDFLNFKWQGSFATHQFLIQQSMRAACFFAEQLVTKHIVLGARQGQDEKFQMQAMGYTIFPTQSLTLPDYPINMDDGSDPTDTKNRPLYLFGCIAYGDQFNKSIHHTRYCYQIPAPITNFTGGSVPSCGISTDAD
jgi:hypothetical protein